MFEAQIRRGVKWLNKNEPNWLSKIEPDDLDLGEAQHCVLGQVYEDYFQALRKKGLSEEDAIILGFAVGNSCLLDDLEENVDELNSILTEEWLAVIDQEREKLKIGEYSKYDVVFKLKNGYTKIGTARWSKLSNIRVGTDYDIPVLLSVLKDKVVKFI